MKLTRKEKLEIVNSVVTSRIYDKEEEAILDFAICIIQEIEKRGL